MVNPRDIAGERRRIRRRVSSLLHLSEVESKLRAFWDVRCDIIAMLITAKWDEGRGLCGGRGDSGHQVGKA